MVPTEWRVGSSIKRWFLQSGRWFLQSGKIVPTEWQVVPTEWRNGSSIKSWFLQSGRWFLQSGEMVPASKGGSYRVVDGSYRVKR